MRKVVVLSHIEVHPTIYVHQDRQKENICKLLRHIDRLSYNLTKAGSFIFFITSFAVFFGDNIHFQA